MIKKKRTKDLAYIRLQIRNCIRAYIRDEGMPHFYSSNNHEYSHRLKRKEIRNKDKKGKPNFYYVKSDRAIAVAAEKIMFKILGEKMFDKINTETKRWRW